jgi:hypothetical protein
MVRFGLVELDLLATHAGARFPFPLRVPEFGRIEAEQEVLRAAAGVTLRMRGLASERGPLGVAAEVVRALREYRGTVDLVLTGPDAAVGVVAMVYRSWTLLCHQQFAGDPTTDVVRIRRVAQNELADELIRMVPEVKPAVVMPITLPPNAGDPGGDPGGDPDALETLGVALPELTGAGRLGGSLRRAGENVRADTELSWLDGPRGRVRVNRTADGWVSVNALRQNELRTALRDLAMTARREHDGS